VRILNAELKLIEIKNAKSTQYFCSKCLKLLAQVEKGELKKFESCKHFYTKQLSKLFYIYRLTGDEIYIEKDKDYYYMLVPNVEDQ